MTISPTPTPTLRRAAPRRAALTLPAALTLLTLLPTPSHAVDITCPTPTLDQRSSGTTPPCNGTEEDDFINGSPFAELIFGNGGDDVINGNGGGDTISGGDGGDILSGNAGNDNLNGGGGDDRLIGDEGTDTFDGGPGEDTCVVEAGETSANCDF